MTFPVISLCLDQYLDLYEYKTLPFKKCVYLLKEISY